MKTIKKYGKAILWLILSIMFITCSFASPADKGIQLKTAIYTLLFSGSLYVAAFAFSKAHSENKNTEGDITGYDADSVREKSLSRIQLPIDIIENLKYKINKAVEEGHTSAKFATYPKNPPGSNTQSVKNYLLLLGFNVMVDKKGGHFVIIKWT